MSVSPSIHADEWLSALLAAQAKNDGGQTAQEWAAQMKCSHKTALERIKQAAARGWVVVGRRSSMSIDGRNTFTPVYTIKKPGGKK